MKLGSMKVSARLEPRSAFNLAVLLLCAVVPVLAPALGEPFYVHVFARIMIWAIAAVSLNLIMGYGGMISFGHAVYLGIGGYTVGILAYHGIESAYIQWPLALALSACSPSSSAPSACAPGGSTSS
jgi:branched-chain amino acid transport system permease protein